MAQTRKHHPPQPQHKAGHRPRTRTRGRIVWAILLGVFGLVMGFFASSQNLLAMAAGAIIGAALGYMIGKNLDEDSGA